MPFTGALGRHPKAILRVLEVICVVVLVLAFLSVSLQVRYKDTAADGKRTAQIARDAAARANRAVAAIQESRIEITWQACFSGDRKTVDARNAVETLARSAPSTPEGQQGAAQFRNVTVTILSSFLPYTDCPAQLHQRFGVHYPATVPDARHDWAVLQRERGAQTSAP